LTSRSPILLVTILLAAAIAGGVMHGCGGVNGFPDGANEGGVLPSDGGNPGLAGVGGTSGLAGTTGTAPAICGEPGTPCCDSNTCNGGGCCVAGICMAVGGSCVGLGGGTCNDGACGTCGRPGLPCCSGSCTAPGTKCNAGTCAKCGDLGGPCCTGSSGTSICNSANAICSNGMCIACGAPGNPCCAANACQGGCCYSGTCVGESASCGANGGTCQAGRCSACGGAAQPCCASVCYDNLYCKSNTCTTCGEAGQVCCPAGGSTPQCQAGSACTSSGTDGVCARCGGLGDICCAGNACTDGCCSGGRCIAGSCSTPDAAVGTGGKASGGSTGAGGVIGTGGIISTGGIVGTGGIVSTGGLVGTGGVVSTGGVIRTGGVSSTGGTTSATGGTGGCGYLIDDMEADTGQICHGNGRVGLWYTYLDTSASSAITPATSGAALPSYMSSPRGTSYYAMHVQGYYSTYAALAVWLNKATFAGTTGTYDASAYKGITFWAKGNGNGGGFNAIGQMASTEMVKYGGLCTATSCAGDYYTLTGLSSTTWKQYTVPFTSLTGGTVTPFDPTSTWSFEFQFYSTTSLAGVAFDLWIDDLSFY